MEYLLSGSYHFLLYSQGGHCHGQIKMKFKSVLEFSGPSWHHYWCIVEAISKMEGNTLLVAGMTRPR